MTPQNTSDTGERVSSFVSSLANFEGLKFRITLYYRGQTKVERVMGIEPTSRAWEAHVLPLYDTRWSVYILPNASFRGNSFTTQPSGPIHERVWLYRLS